MNKVVSNLCRGLTAVMASVLVVSSTGYGIANTWRSQVDGALGTQSYVIQEGKEKHYKADYANVDEMAAAAKALAVKEGEEGTVIMKNDNNALPLQKSKKVALFGFAAWHPFLENSGDLKAGNADAVDLKDSLVNAGFTLEGTVKKIYDGISAHSTTSQGSSGGTTTTYTYGYVASPGDLKDYKINEVPAGELANIANQKLAADNQVSADWKNDIVKEDTVGIVVFARGAGEGNMFKNDDGALDWQGNPTHKDPLALSEDELSLVDAAKETCSKVVVLINAGNNMEIGEIAKGGAHEVDAIGYIGCVNDYQCEGIVKVLSGASNATGAMADTYVKDNTSLPAMMNVNGGEYADASIASSAGTDNRWGATNIANSATDSFGGGAASYSGGTYIVEAEGIYVGYKYYETRYYDAMKNQGNANSTKGSMNSEAWDYDDNVVFTFGHGLSYYEYKQTVKSVNVDKSASGNITAVIEIENLSDTKANFLAQLYVQQPYTEYDKANGVEKSAIMFLTSAKKEVAAHAKAEVTVTVPTKYLASYDANGAKTYILDDGDYHFTAAAGAHEAVNNVLKAQGVEVEAKGETKVWSQDGLDSTTFATSHGVAVTNAFDTADLNYYAPGTVTYLSRSDWDATYPINYNEVTVKIGTSAKKAEWIKEIQGRTYEIKKGEEVENVDGKNKGLRFTADQLDQHKDVDDEYWSTLVSQISVNEAVGAVLHGGSQSDVLKYVDNPIVKQSEGVNGFTGKVDGHGFNVNSMTLLATSFNPDLAYEWGKVEGNSGLFLQKYDLWGMGLTQRRTPYNGRNYEYVSEDSMLANIIGRGVEKGCVEKGIMNGPKHMGANDQEHNRAGIAEYMTEQKIREGDLRCFQGALDAEEGGGMAVMIAFNRIGATNAAHHVGMLQQVLRGEWDYNYLISTDMMNNKYYFNGESMIMAGITQVADFGGNNSFINKNNDHTKGDSNWSYITIDSIKNDATLVNQARENLKYQLYAFANSAVIDVTTEQVTTWWDTAFNTAIMASAVLTGVTFVGWVLTATLGNKSKKEGK